MQILLVILCAYAIVSMSGMTAPWDLHYASAMMTQRGPNAGLLIEGFHLPELLCLKSELQVMKYLLGLAALSTWALMFRFDIQASSLHVACASVFFRPGQQFACPESLCCTEVFHKFAKLGCLLRQLRRSRRAHIEASIGQSIASC